MDEYFLLGNCSAGFYCPQGEITDSNLPCWVGYYCPEHSHIPLLCPSGWYQDQPGKAFCKLCPGGYYCDNSFGVVVINDTVGCPEGSYCPPGNIIKLLVFK